MKDSTPILNILEEQVRCYGSLYGLLKSEKEAIVSFDPAVFEELAKQKDNLVLQLRLLEDERKRLTDEFFSEEDTGRSISDLYAVTGDERFVRIRSRLMSLLQGIEELNEINRLLIERASLHLSASANFFQTFNMDASRKVTVSREA